MTKKRETRRAQIRAAEVDGKPGVTLKTITPNVVDDWGSVFMPDTFDEHLEVRRPVLCWSHDWSEPLGPAVSVRAGEDGAPEIDFAFSDFDAVPIARRAHAQVSDGTIGDCSVGFSNTQRRSPTKDEEKRWPGVYEIITKAELDEVSLVLRGAVPGAKVLSVRSSAEVDLDAVVALAKRVAAGELTQEEAKVAVDLLGGDPEGGDGEDPPAAPPAEPEQPDELDVELDAQLDAALDAALGRSARR